jgi:thymidine kinase
MGKIEAICGPMFSGKSEELIRRMNRFKYSKKDFLLIKPKIDDRYSADQVVSHNKTKLPAVVVETADDLAALCNRSPHIKNIGIEEVQFIKDGETQTVVQVISQLKREGCHVIVAGLDMDSNGQPFSFMPDLLAIADDVQKLKAVCFSCGEDASMSHRKSANKEIVHVGANDEYAALCFDCWAKLNSKTAD